MSGNFILNTISKVEWSYALHDGLGEWGDLMHRDVGWNAASRAQLDRVLNMQEIPNRDGLPPHRYLTFQYAGNNNPDQTAKFLQGTSNNSWVDANRLLRPSSMVNNNQLTAINAKAKDFWAKGKLHDCLVAQFQESHSVVIEIYHLDGKEMS